MALPFMPNIRNLLPSFRQLNSLRGIQSREGFHNLLQRERARADRSGVIFSLVCFDATRMNGYAVDSLKGLAKVLAGRVREIDRVGWYDDLCLAVLLPVTGSKGAWIFADDVMGKTSVSRSPSFRCSVYTYPSSWISTKVQQEEEGDRSGLSDREKQKASSRRSPASNPGTERSTASMNSLFGSGIPLWKRSIDIIGAILALILLSPVFLLISAVIKLVSPGPVLFRQQRVGQGGKIFTFLKFRTMHVGNDTSIHQQYLSTLIKGDQVMEKLDADRDPRIIRFGRFLRQTCLDELPQLINVLRGDMSLVGPRPCLPYEAEEYLLWHERRFDSIPGMTGLWQVSGKNKTTFKEMIRLDIKYSRKMSFWLDLWILLRTGPTIFMMVYEQLAKKLSVSSKPSTATMEKG